MIDFLFLIVGGLIGGLIGVFLANIIFKVLYPDD